MKKWQLPFQQKSVSIKRKKTLISVPTAGFVLPAMMNDLISLVNHSHNWKTFHTLDCCVIQEARNQAVQRMFDLDCDGVLFIDFDQTFPKDALEKLIDTNKEIVGYPIIRKTPPYYPCIGKWDENKQEYVVYENYPKNNLFKVDYIGMGFTYIRREVFEKLTYPYFDFTWLVNDKHKWGERSIGEDVYFCMNAKKAGFEVWCNPFVEIGHLGMFNFLPKIYDNYAAVIASKEVKK